MIKECSTKYFGNYSYDEESIILFESGLFGFEHENEFLLIQLDPNNENVLCLQSLKDTNLFRGLPPYTNRQRIGNNRGKRYE